MGRALIWLSAIFVTLTLLSDRATGQSRTPSPGPLSSTCPKVTWSSAKKPIPTASTQPIPQWASSALSCASVQQKGGSCKIATSIPTTGSVVRYTSEYEQALPSANAISQARSASVRYTGDSNGQDTATTKVASTAATLAFDDPAPVQSAFDADSGAQYPMVKGPSVDVIQRCQQWQDSKTIGENLWNRLQQSLANPAQFAEPCVDMEANGWESLGGDDPVPNVEVVMENEIFHRAQGFVRVPDSFFDRLAMNDDGFYYGNFMSPRSAAIVASTNNGLTRDKDTGAITKAPNRWHQIVWEYWAADCERQHVDVSSLRWIFRSEIMNEISIPIVTDILTHKLGPTWVKNDHTPEVVPLSPGDDDFNALLGSPNGSGVVNLLVAHQTELKRKTIKKISVLSVAGGKLYMWLELGPA